MAAALSFFGVSEYCMKVYTTIWYLNVWEKFVNYLLFFVVRFTITISILIALPFSCSKFSKIFWGFWPFENVKKKNYKQ